MIIVQTTPRVERKQYGYIREIDRRDAMKYILYLYYKYEMPSTRKHIGLYNEISVQRSFFDTTDTRQVSV